MDGQVQKAYHYGDTVRADLNTKVLEYLADGKQSEARAILERHLDVALVKIVAYERIYTPDGRDGIELRLVREARDYRAHHPWTSQSDVADNLQKAFAWAE
jgi:hypothetical protein